MAVGAWAAVVAHPDPEERRRHELAGTGTDYAAGLRSRDPRRIAVYFSKHGLYAAKGYQNEVPVEWRERGKGPGRFWGVWGLKRCAKGVEVTPQAATTAARVMRRWAARSGRDLPGDGEAIPRWSLRRVGLSRT